MDYIEGSNRDQLTLFPQSLDEYISEDNPVRFIDAYLQELDENDENEPVGPGLQSQASSQDLRDSNNGSSPVLIGASFFNSVFPYLFAPE